jgi:hypothetical protein
MIFRLLIRFSYSNEKRPESSGRYTERKPFKPALDFGFLQRFADVFIGHPAKDGFCDTGSGETFFLLGDTVTLRSGFFGRAAKRFLTH